MFDMKFFNNKKILVTGHTGFKGTWLCKMLISAGAEVTGYALEPNTPSLFTISKIENSMRSVLGDVRDKEKLEKVFHEVQPELVIHLAAQPIVRESYKNPVYTYETNVMGTVNICECIRTGKSVKSFLNVTTDKVYHNNEWEWGYRESDPLDGHDPYSNSKSCSELVTHSYNNSFFKEQDIRVSTARAGNVIGGGDFAEDRIVPDCIRSALTKEVIIVRNPESIRPYQHVLEPLKVYLMILQKQYEDKKYAGFYNVGPDDCDCITTGQLVSVFCDSWKNDQHWKSQFEEGPHEAQFLKLDCSKVKQTFKWKPKWHIKDAIDMTVEWAKTYEAGKGIEECMDSQITKFME